MNKEQFIKETEEEISDLINKQDASCGAMILVLMEEAEKIDMSYDDFKKNMMATGQHLFSKHPEEGQLVLNELRKSVQESKGK